MSVKIRTKNGKLILDIHYGEGRRTRPTTGLKDTVKNRKLLIHDVIPGIEYEISKGVYLPKAERVAVVKTVKEYGELSFQRHLNERRSHVQQTYKNHFYKHIVPKFGKCLVSSITSMQLLDWQNQLLQKYKVSTVKKYKSIFYTIFTDAVIEGIIDSNPFNRVPRPSVIETYNENDDLEEKDNNVEPFTLDELEALFDVVDDSKRNFYAIMAFSGARPGELTGLQWAQVDFTSETFKILRTRIRGGFGPTKTKSSKRTVEMVGAVRDYFLSQFKLTGGNLYDMVFLNSSKKPFYSHDIIAKQFKDLLDDKDERYLYQLRHTFASLMISNGEEIGWVSQMMGHKNIDITLKVYASAYKLQKDKNKRKKRGKFLDNWHKSGTGNNPMYNNPPIPGENR